MRDELNDIERIEQYLLNQMNPQDKLNFELRMMGDLRLGIDANTIIHLYDGINDISVKQIAQQVYRKQQVRKYSIIVAIALILVIATVIFFMNINTSSAPEKTTTPPVQNEQTIDSTKTDKLKAVPAPTAADSVKPKETEEVKTTNPQTIIYKKDSVIKPVLKKVYIEGEGKPTNKIAL